MRSISRTFTITSSSNFRREYPWADSEDANYAYGHGAGGSDTRDIVWTKNKKTGYTEYYNKKTGESWGGYNIA